MIQPRGEKLHAERPMHDEQHGGDSKKRRSVDAGVWTTRQGVECRKADVYRHGQAIRRKETRCIDVEKHGVGVVTVDPTWGAEW